MALKQKKRSDGRLQRTFTVNGKRYFVYGHSKQELDENEHIKRLEIEQRLDMRKNPTLNQYHEKWEEARYGEIKESTIRKQYFQYKGCAEVRIESAGCSFGDLRLRDISKDDLREVQKALVADNKATSTVNGAIAHLSHIFHDAVKERIIDYNPCVLIKPLKRTEAPARETTHRALSIDEQMEFFEAAIDSFYYDSFRMAVLTGMRCGEIGALYYSDIKNGLIHVHKTITKTVTGSYVIGDTTKTRAGSRTIPINDDIMEVIEHQKEINRMLEGDKVIPLNDRIFKAPERGLLMSTPANREITRICKRTGIEKFQFHAFRDTFATRSIEQGMNPKTLQEILGHSDFSMTMNLYGHVLDDTKRKAMNELHIPLNRAQ